MATQDSCSAEEEVMIAADLTLYQNPLSTVLNAAKAAKAMEQRNEESCESPAEEVKPASSERATKEEEEWIASDMTKYDSPLADMERQAQLRNLQNVSQTK